MAIPTRAEEDSVFQEPRESAGHGGGLRERCPCPGNVPSRGHLHPYVPERSLMPGELD